jgi:hypothetical protein
MVEGMGVAGQRHQRNDEVRRKIEGNMGEKKKEQKKR